MRIVSLIASATEIVGALGFEEQLVGRSHECDYPRSRCAACPSAPSRNSTSKAAATRSTSASRRIVQESLSVYRVDGGTAARARTGRYRDAGALRGLRGQLARSRTDRLRLAAACPKLVSLMPNCLADVWADIDASPKRSTSGARRRTDRRLQGRMDGIADQAKALPQRPTVACIEWIDPLMAAGNWMPELVEMAGGVNLLRRRRQAFAGDDVGATCRRRSRRDLRVCRAASTSTHHARDAVLLTAEPEWPRLRAVRDGRVVRRGRQPVLQPSGTAAGRIAGDSGGTPASRRVPVRA